MPGPYNDVEWQGEIDKLKRDLEAKIQRQLATEEATKIARKNANMAEEAQLAFQKKMARIEDRENTLNQSIDEVRQTSAKIYDEAVQRAYDNFISAMGMVRMMCSRWLKVVYAARRRHVGDLESAAESLISAAESVGGFFKIGKGRLEEQTKLPDMKFPLSLNDEDKLDFISMNTQMQRVDGQETSSLEKELVKDGIKLWLLDNGYELNAEDKVIKVRNDAYLGDDINLGDAITSDHFNNLRDDHARGLFEFFSGKYQMCALPTPTAPTPTIR